MSQIRINEKTREAFENLLELLKQIEGIVDVVLVEGNRDTRALRNIGYTGEIVPCSQIGISNYELVEDIAQKFSNVLILTDFDREGVLIENNFRGLFEHKNIKVEDELRRRIGNLMARLRIYAIESIDNVKEKLDRNLMVF